MRTCSYGFMTAHYSIKNLQTEYKTSRIYIVYLRNNMQVERNAWIQKWCVYVCCCLFIQWFFQGKVHFQCSVGFIWLLLFVHMLKIQTHLIYLYKSWTCADFQIKNSIKYWNFFVHEMILFILFFLWVFLFTLTSVYILCMCK